MTLRLACIAAALGVFTFAALIGFGHWPERLEDVTGWIALGLALLAAAQLPLDDWRRRPPPP